MSPLSFTHAEVPKKKKKKSGEGAHRGQTVGGLQNFAFPVYAHKLSAYEISISIDTFPAN